MAELTRKAATKDASAPKAKKPAASAPSPTIPEKKTGMPKPLERKPEETDDFTEVISRPVTGAWDYLMAGYPSLYLSLLKLNIVRNVLYFLSITVLFGILFGIVLAFPGLAAGSPLFFWGAMIVVILIGFALILWMAQTFESAAYLLVAQKIAGKPYSMSSALRSASGPTLRFSLLDLGLRILVLVPGLLLFLVPFGLQMGTGMSAFLAPGLAFAYVAFLIYYFFANIAYEFLVQFWRYGLLMEGLGAVASLKRSLSLIRSRPIETFVFNLVYLVVFVVFSIPPFIFGVVVYVVLMFVQIISVLALGMVGYAVYVAVALLLSLIGILFSSMMEAACRPLHYLFWKGISEKLKE